MSYRFDPYDNSIVIDGFEKGIAESPTKGIADLRNVNITSIPGEASVAFKTAPNSSATLTGSVISADAGTDYITVSSTAGFDGGEAIVFAGGSLPAGIVAGTTYWVGNVNGAGNGTMKLYAVLGGTSLLNITSDGTGTFSTYTMYKPKYFARDTRIGDNYMVDDHGQVWSDKFTTGSLGYWIYTGNKVPTYQSCTNGNGLVYYAASDGTGYLFVFHNSSIDYTPTATIGWQYQWSPSAGTVGAYNATPTAVLKTSLGSNGNHEALVGTDNRVYYLSLIHI